LVREGQDENGRTKNKVLGLQGDNELVITVDECIEQYRGNGSKQEPEDESDINIF
jgi:hypothetical protein